MRRLLVILPLLMLCGCVVRPVVKSLGPETGLRTVAAPLAVAGPPATCFPGHPEVGASSPAKPKRPGPRQALRRIVTRTTPGLDSLPTGGYLRGVGRPARLRRASPALARHQIGPDTLFLEMFLWLALFVTGLGILVSLLAGWAVLPWAIIFGAAAIGYLVLLLS